MPERRAGRHGVHRLTLGMRMTIVVIANPVAGRGRASAMARATVALLEGTE